MNDHERARLMHVVLDGEATQAEARELDRLLAAEPAARTEFEHLRRLFDGLNRVPKVFPPEGLVAAVMANIPQNSPPQKRLDQLSLRSRVIGLASMKARGKSPGKSATDLPAHQPAIYLREWKMNEQNSSLLRKRNVWIGGGIAIAAALIALSYTIDFPPGAQNTVGTIVPAQRYKAAQPVIEDIKAGGQAATQSVPVQAGSATNAAASNATDRAAAQATLQNANQATDRAAAQATLQNANQATDRAAAQATLQNANQATDRAATQATLQNANQATDRAAAQATLQNANQATDRAAAQATLQNANQATDRAAAQATAQSANQALDRATSQAISNAAAR